MEDNIIIEELINDELSSEQKREIGLYLWKTGKRSEAIKYLREASKEGDLDASTWIGIMLYNKVFNLKEGDPVEEGIKLLYGTALKGSLPARTYLNRLCVEQYNEIMDTEGKQEREPGPLVDFDGNIIKINRKGLTTPVDAVLEYVDGINRLTFSLNLCFFDEELSNSEEFKKSVVSGIKEWEGEYTVFGGQKLQVCINVTTESRLLDSVYILPITKSVAEQLERMPQVSKKQNHFKEMLVRQNRSVAGIGFRKWSTKSLKMICFASADGKFDNYNYTKCVAKHEFGHALGLGDLYRDTAIELEGVEKGQYKELDGYHIYNRHYNLVMSDSRGLISNNDIEMVVLAFSENRMQLYQKGKKMGNAIISKALGRGN